MSLTLTKLRETNNVRSIEWAGHAPAPEDLTFCAIELGGEAGEALDAVKKLFRQMEGMPNEDRTRRDCLHAIAEECADIIISVDRLASCLDINLNKAVRAKFNKTSDKHGFKTKL